MKKKACAKINLVLDVAGKRSDGYHNVDMIMQTIGLCDIIDVDLVLDLALLKINRKNLASTKFGSYESLKTGENVVSIGNSKGEGMSITEGLVSDRNRQLAGQNKILISVPINHGNSGGPLFNMKGQVVGVVCSSKKNAVAMNYAIPVDQVVKFISKIENEQEIKVFN